MDPLVTTTIVAAQHAYDRRRPGAGRRPEAKDQRDLRPGPDPRPPARGAGRREPRAEAAARREAEGDGDPQRRLRILVQGRRDRSAVPGLL